MSLHVPHTQIVKVEEELLSDGQPEVLMESVSFALKLCHLVICEGMTGLFSIMAWSVLFTVVVLTILPYFAAADTCLSPSFKPKVYTTTDASVAQNSVMVIELSVTCKNGIKDLNLYAELNGHAIPASKIKNSNNFQVSFSASHKDMPGGRYAVRFFDEEGYSALRKAQRSGDNTKTISSLFTVPVNHPGASQGVLVQSEFVATAVAMLVCYIAHNARSKLQNSSSH